MFKGARLLISENKKITSIGTLLILGGFVGYKLRKNIKANAAAKVDGVKEQHAHIKEKVEKQNGHIKNVEIRIVKRKTHSGKKRRSRNN